jgi:Protein of unknown function (DUF2786)
MTTPNPDLLDRVRKLLAKAEDDGVTPAEAEALTAKAAELMARYGIDRALLGAVRPDSDKPTDRIFELPNPWGAVKSHLLAGLAAAMRCQCILLGRREEGVIRLHVFGYASDIERADMLFTSLLVQMNRALAAATAPGTEFGAAMTMHHSPKAWRRSYLLGFASAVVGRVREAEQRAARASDTERSDAGEAGKSTALVLADRSLVVRSMVSRTYPRTRTTRVTYTGNGYGSGYQDGQRADIGGAKLRRGATALSR